MFANLSLTRMGLRCTGIGFGFILKVEYGAWGGVPPPSGGSGGGFWLDPGYPPPVLVSFRVLRGVNPPQYWSLAVVPENWRFLF